MLSDKIFVTQVGLAEADLRLIETVFTLSADLAQAYSLITDKLLPSADIVFIDADTPDALTQWQAAAGTNAHATLIKVTSDAALAADGLVLSRPLSLKKLMSALQSITSTDKTSTTGAAHHGHSMQQILVVDDSYSVRKYMEDKLPELSKTPISVQFADSGEAAMDKLKQKKFDLVFLDVVMPGIDGYQVCKWIKSEQPAYVVMLTSKKSPFDKVRGNMSGCDAYIAKPPQDDRLQKVLEKSSKASQRIIPDRSPADSFQHNGLLTTK